MKKLKKYLKNELENIEEFIIERAKLHIDENLSYAKMRSKYELFDLDMDKFPVSDYDQEEISNHSFDLGAMIAIKNVIKEIEKYENKD